MSILNVEISNFLFKYNEFEAGILGEIQKEAIKCNIPIISNETASLLKTLIILKKPNKILEIGCAVGFSASLMKINSPMDSQLTTIEINPNMIIKAKENFKKLGLIINIIESDALLAIKNIHEKFDVIFLDAAKSQYINLIYDVLNILNNDGVLIVDNVLQKGTVAKKIDDIPRRDRTIHRRMNEFLEVTNKLEDYHSTIVPIGDGVLLLQRSFNKEKQNDN